MCNVLFVGLFHCGEFLFGGCNYLDDSAQEWFNPTIDYFVISIHVGKCLPLSVGTFI